MSDFARRSSRRRIVVAALFVAAGQLAAAWLAATEVLWCLVAAPVLMALTLVAAGFYLQRLGGRQVVWTSLILATSVVAACALAAQDGPEKLRELLPVIGGATGYMVVILPSSAVGRRRVC
jgi:MFS-type transporter involved in bile tolerance (Atg22 family)